MDDKKILKVRQEGGAYIHEIYKGDDKMISYVFGYECKCVTLDGQFGFRVDGRDGEKKTAYNYAYEAARKRALTTKRDYIQRAFEFFETEVVNAVRHAVENLDTGEVEEAFRGEMANFETLWPLSGVGMRRRILQMKAEGRAELRGLELVYREGER